MRPFMPVTNMSLCMRLFTRKEIMMHPFLNQQLAQQHIDDLRHESEVAQLGDQIKKAGSTLHRWDYLSFLRGLYSWPGRLYRRPTPVQTARLDEVNLEEIKPAVLSTFLAMHEVGLVSEYDDQFIEKFVQMLEQELALQARCHSV